VSAARRKAQTELLTLTQAARQCGVSRSALRRALDGDRFPGAVQSDDDRGTWLVPVQDLVDAGYLHDSTEQSADSPEQVADRSPDSAGQVAGQVGPGVGLVRWEDVQGLVGQLVTAQDDRARAETELRVTTFQLEQAQAELARLRAEQATQVQPPTSPDPGRTGWWRARR
jgi:hypothetical protein